MKGIVHSIYYFFSFYMFEIFNNKFFKDIRRVYKHIYSSTSDLICALRKTHLLNTVEHIEKLIREYVCRFSK